MRSTNCYDYAFPFSSLSARSVRNHLTLSQRSLSTSVLLFRERHGTGFVFNTDAEPSSPPQSASHMSVPRLSVNTSSILKPGVKTPRSLCPAPIAGYHIVRKPNIASSTCCRTLHVPLTFQPTRQLCSGFLQTCTDHSLAHPDMCIITVYRARHRGHPAQPTRLSMTFLTHPC